MKKSSLLALFTLIIYSCSSNPDTGFSGGSSDPFLITGNTEQPGVDYRSSNVELNFDLVEQVGDSTFSAVNIDLDNDNTTDLVFRLVDWADNSVLTATAENGFSITEGGTEFEIISAEISLKTISLFSAGTSINSQISIDNAADLLFVTHVLEGNHTSADPRIWAEVVYLPFQSNTLIGWIGLRLLSSSTNDIQGIQINTIATRD